jgi:hypothetical protein
MLAAFYYWVPKILGKSYNPVLGKIHFWTFFIGVNCKENDLIIISTDSPDVLHALRLNLTVLSQGAVSSSFLKQQFKNHQIPSCLYSTSLQISKRFISNVATPRLSPIFWYNIETNIYSIYEEIRGKAGV